MKNKNKLKNTAIYIENDMTKRKREIQKDIREIAKCKKVGYQKLIISSEDFKREKQSDL